MLAVLSIAAGSPTGLEPTTEQTSYSAWTAIAGSLRKALTDTIYDTWFAQAEPQSLDDSGLRVALPNDFTRDWVESHFSALVSAAAREAIGQDLPVSFVISDGPSVSSETRPAAPPSAEALGPAPVTAHGPVNERDELGAALPRHDRARPEPEVHVRPLHHRVVEPLRARCRACRRGGAGPGLQPALHLRRHRPRQDAPAAGDRALRPPALASAHATLRHERDVHERLHRLAARQADRGVQAPLPRLRRPPHRRHPVLRGQGADPGGVLPHVQLAVRERLADHHLVRPAAARDRDARGAAALEVRVGARSPTSSRPTSRRESRSCARR